MRSAVEQLSPADWSVLALVAERPTHGFALAQALAPGGAVGCVWTVRRPLVYRSIEILAGRRLIEPAGTERSTSGPPRTILKITSNGRRLLGHWLREPVTRVRQARSELMLKLLFLDRAGSDPSRLLRAQREVLDERARELRSEADRVSGFESTLAIWRQESTLAALRVCDALLSNHEANNSKAQEESLP